MIDELVEQIEARFAELEQEMSDPAVIGDRERYAAVGREYSELEPARDLAREYKTLRDDLRGGSGDDRLRGKAGNDKLDGGPDTDECDQGPGAGPISNCEVTP